MMTALIIALVFALMTFSITVFAEGEGAAESAPFAYATALSLLPPVIAIVLALITKEVYSSLFIGVLVGSMLAASFSPAGTMDVMINDGLISAVSGSAGIFIFP